VKMYNRIKRFLRSLEEYSTLVFSFIITSIFYRNSNLAYAKVKKIAIIKLDQIGDVILSIPAIANIRERFPDALITMVVNPLSEPIAKLFPYIDEVLCYNARFFDRSGNAKILDIPKGIRFAVNMRKRNFDLIVDLRGSWASLFFATISKSKYRIDRGSYLVKRKLNRSKAELDIAKSSFAVRQRGDSYTLKHEAEIALDIISKAGIDIVTKKAILKEAKSTYTQSNYSPNIIIHPGGPMLQKRWSTENYVELINQILRNFQSHVFIIGGKDESELVKLIVSNVNNERVDDLSGKLSLTELVGTLKKADLFIGNDSGPMHIASACGIKVIGLFGPTDPERFGPYGENCIALRMEENCPPCSHGKCKFSDYRCIDQISVERVINTVNEILGIG
jgi:heptosyltransferase-2